jgi:hypothetical protein
VAKKHGAGTGVGLLLRTGVRCRVLSAEERDEASLAAQADVEARRARDGAKGPAGGLFFVTT